MIRNNKLSELHDKLTDKLLEKINDPEVKSSDLNVARQFLKDNNIDNIPLEDSPLKKLAEKLPFKEKELKEVYNSNNVIKSK
jgi:hypothetical protein|tara:strand:+ start:136 stop:381 length:246 start_codon:yes stop_codon:yes gene_type:complete